MKIGYIKEEILKNQFWRGIEIRIFDNNYVIAVSDKKKDKIRVKERLIKIIKKLKIDALVFSKSLQGDFENSVFDLLNSNNAYEKHKSSNSKTTSKPIKTGVVSIINGKKLMEFMEYDIVKYVLDKQNADTKKEDIYIVFKRDSNLNLDFLKIFLEKFRLVNIVTNDVDKLKNIQDNLLDNEGILISVSNNKRKALKRAKYILNINLTKEELEKYRINREAVIINIKESVKYDEPCFDGVNINYFEISCPDEYFERFEAIEKTGSASGAISIDKCNSNNNNNTNNNNGNQFDLAQMYESILLQDRMDKTKLEAVYKRIKEDNIKIVGLIGNNGPISDQELQKIHIQNLDKMRKLV